MLDIEGYVLTGGASSRMGREKAGLEFDGRTLAERSARVLRELATDVFAVGGTAVTGIPFVPDFQRPVDENDRASIFGLYSALLHSNAEWTAVLACDLPFVSSGYFRRLISIAGSVDQKVAAVIPIQPDEMLQPLAALYRTRVSTIAIEQMVAKNDRRLRSIPGYLTVKLVTPADYADLDPDGRMFFNLNTPEDLERAAEYL
jgi:molybdenum cofactor guanylyltransferase